MCEKSIIKYFVTPEENRSRHEVSLVQFCSDTIYRCGPDRNIKISWMGKVTVKRIVCLSHQKK